MPDIWKCKGNECNMKNECYRYTSKASIMQSYFIDIPLNKDGTCDHQMEVY